MLTTLSAAWSWLAGSALGRWIAAALGVVGVILAVRARGYADGKSAEQQRARRLAEEGLREAREIERRVRATPEDDLRDELERWGSK